MADDLNSLLQAQHNSTFLSGVMNPATFNPLAAQNSAVAAASNMYNLKGLQSQEAWGDALQQATDPKTGVVDYAAAARIAAAKGDVTRMGMLTSLTGASNLNTQQIEQSHARQLDFAKDALSNLFDNSDEAIRARAEEKIRAGVPAAQVYAHRDALLAMDPKIRAKRAYSFALSVMDPGASLDRELGKITLQQAGGEIIAPNVQQAAPGRPGGLSLTPGSATVTLSPNEAANQIITVEANQAMVDESNKPGNRPVKLGEKVPFNRLDWIAGAGLAAVIPQALRQQYLQSGVRNPDQTPVSRTNPAVTTPPARPAPRQIYTGPTLTNPGNNFPLLVPQAPAAAAPAPTVPPAPAPVARPASGPPSVPLSTPPIPAGARPAPPSSRSDLGGGVQTASANALEAPQTGPPSPPSALVPPDVAAIQAGIQNAQNTPRIPGTQMAGAQTPSYGAGVYEKATTDLSADTYKADKQSALSHATTVLPLAQALSIYGRGGVTTAPGADRWNTIRGWANGVARSMGLPEIVGSTRDWDDLNKTLNQIATNTPASGRSDAQLAAILSGNASGHIHELVGADKVKSTVALVRMLHVMPAEWDRMSEPEKAQYGYQFANFKQNFNKTFDLRAGAFDAYTAAQKKSLVDDLRAHPEQEAQFWNSVEMLERNGYLGETRTLPHGK